MRLPQDENKFERVCTTRICANLESGHTGLGSLKSITALALISLI